MAATPEINRLAQEYREQNPNTSSFDGLDPEDMAPWPPAQLNEGLAERRFRLARFKLAAWIAPPETADEFKYSMLREMQSYHGSRALELTSYVADRGYEPATVLRGAQVWLATALQVRHLDRAYEATMQLDALSAEDDTLQTAVS